MKYLIVGLGNIGDEYKDTRHNIGFMVLDVLADSFSADFSDKRYGSVSSVKFRGRELLLLKPSTYMNLSGNAVNYWLKKEKIEITNLLVIVDDLALPAGSIRMKPKGSDGGHNGLAHINTVLGTNQYSRIRVGIGNEFSRGTQKNYVLGRWTRAERAIIDPRINVVTDMIKSFALVGTGLTMTAFNKLGKEVPGTGPANEKS
jgi:PTH1 family peptidyl-tRNA hydrolase